MAGNRKKRNFLGFFSNEKIIILIFIISFILWILPLGFFIKPSQEKFACDGQRAICMCQV